MRRCAVVASAAAAPRANLASVQPRQQTQRLLPACQRGAEAAEQLRLWQDLPDEHSFNCSGLSAVWEEEEGGCVVIVRVYVCMCVCGVRLQSNVRLHFIKINLSPTIYCRSGRSSIHAGDPHAA